MWWAWDVETRTRAATILAAGPRETKLFVTNLMTCHTC